MMKVRWHSSNFMTESSGCMSVMRTGMGDGGRCAKGEVQGAGEEREQLGWLVRKATIKGVGKCNGNSFSCDTENEKKKFGVFF